MTGFFASCPYSCGDGEIAPKFCQKSDSSPHLVHCHNQTAQHVKTGKHSFEKGITALHFGEKYASLPLSIFKELR